MSPNTNDIHIEEEGFITTKKGFTLDDKRNKTDKNDIQDILANWKKY